jgi:hypothetical protein
MTVGPDEPDVVAEKGLRKGQKPAKEEDHRFTRGFIINSS